MAPKQKRVMHCRCPWGCGAPNRTRKRCSCIGGNSHQCRGGGGFTEEQKRENENEEHQDREVNKHEEDKDESEQDSEDSWELVPLLVADVHGFLRAHYMPTPSQRIRLHL